MIITGTTEIPDVTGYPADIAGKMLKDAGVETVLIVKTAAPFVKQPAGKPVIPQAARVLRQKIGGDGTVVELTVGEYE